MAYNPNNPNGQATAANSAPVVLASDQTTVPVKVTDGTNVVSIFPSTFLRTTDEPRQVFYDNFDSAPDTVNVWNSTQGSGGVAAAVVNGILSLGAGTLANGFSKILSIPSFKLPIPGWLGFSDAIALSDGASPTANVARYWGTFSSPAAPTTSAPITDGYVFEESTTGKLSAVVYAAGVRTLIADLSSSGTNVQPLDALYHRYLIYVRTDKTYYYIDGVGPSNLVATTNFQSPAIQTLGTGLLVVNGPTPPVSNIQIQCAGLAVWDTGKNATQIADGTFPWIKSTVKKGSTAAVATDTAEVVAFHPSSPLPVGANVIGKTGIDQTTPGTTNGVQVLVSALPTGASQDGTDITTPTAMPSGGVGIRGWLSAIWTKLNGVLDISDRAARLLGVIGTGANIIGKVGVDQTTDGTTNAVRLLPETTKVIGTINLSAAQTLATVTTVSAVTAITNALPIGANVIGKLSIDQTTPGTTNLVQVGGTLPAGTNTLGTVKVQGAALTGQTTGFAATITGATTGLDVSVAGNATFIVKNTIPATAFTGTPVIVFEQSDDNVSWGPLSVVRSDTNISLSTHTLPAGTANSSLMFDAGMEGVNWVRARVTTGTTTNGMTIVVQPGGMPFSPTVSSILNNETTKVIGTINVSAAQTIAVTQATAANLNATIVQATAANLNMTAAPIAITKGTQGATGFTTQDLKDAGRNQVHYYTLIPVLSTATDTLQSLTGTKAGATVVATTTPQQVSASKTLRITRLAVTYIATATSGYAIVRLRFVVGGPVTITGPIAATVLVGAGAPTTANSTASEEAILDEGWEFAATTGIGISVQGFAAVTPTAVGYVLVSVTGYEY